MQIQEYLIAAIQNIQVLLKYGYEPKKSLSLLVNQVKGVIPRLITPVSDMIKGLIITKMNRIMSKDFVGIGRIKS